MITIVDKPQDKTKVSDINLDTLVEDNEVISTLKENDQLVVDSIILNSSEKESAIHHSEIISNESTNAIDSIAESIAIEVKSPELKGKKQPSTNLFNYN